MRIRTIALLACALCTSVRADDAPTSQPTAVPAAQLIVMLPKNVGPIPMHDATEIPDMTGMGVTGCTGHYKIGDNLPDFADVDLNDYGGNDFVRSQVNAVVGIGKNVTDAGGTYKTIKINGWPAEEFIATHGAPVMITVIVNGRFILCFHSGLMTEGPFKPAVEAYDFSKLAALGK